MAMNDISLTDGMRSNLVQLQGTVTLLNRTQDRLATGKKVNTPLDNPINYFAAQGHLSRAADISQYKDIMAEGIQTIQAANAGIKGIQGLIEAARSLAQSALSANPNQVSFTLDAKLAVDDVITIGGQAFTAKATDASGNTQFNIKDSAGNLLSTDEMIANLTAKVNQNTESTSTAWGDIKATSSGSRMILQSSAVDKAISDVSDAVKQGSIATTTLKIDTSVTSARSSLAEQYESLLTQLDTLAGTASYKGTNLLTKDTLSVTFEGGSIAVKGFNAYASDLGVNTAGYANWTVSSSQKWVKISDIKLDITNMDKGVAKLKSESSKLSSALSVINIQQEFATTKINLLTSGADNLTAADTNEEGANMLMLQTRQALSTTALSMSAQASQSVLRLFA